MPCNLETANTTIALSRESKEEIKVCAIVAYKNYGPDYKRFEAGHELKFANCRSQPDFVMPAEPGRETHVVQYDGAYWHKDRQDMDAIVSQRHLAIWGIT